MNKKLLLLIIPIVFILIGFGILLSKKFLIPKKTHYHAGFVVFQNNKQINFSDMKYMFLEPCTLSKKGDGSTADIQIEKAHLHDNVGDLVHIERTGAKWQDLFTNIHFPINYSQSTAYINGNQIANFQNQPIKNDDSLVIFIGKNDPKFLSQAVTKQYIEKIAKRSTTCGD